MRLKHIGLFILIGMLFSCKKQQSELDAFKSVKSTCEDITGVKGLYWDLSNGVARGDIPGGVPVIENPDPNRFTYTEWPLLSVEFPVGYRAEKLGDGNPNLIGVDVIRNDNLVVWRYYNDIFSGQLTTTDVLRAEINNFLNGFGFSADQIQIDCTNGPKTQPITSSMFTGFESRLIQVGDMTAQFTANVTYASDLNTSFYHAQVSFAPIGEYETVVMSTFLPIHWQLFVTDKEFVDSDGDGVVDQNDNFPFDPKRQ
ncbi:hypothetical protein ACE01N_01740 [Saccharicrinis sp. FJH2]|uniref:hypothetical protein n=1 Tax=Saccharicrinis sp. FJH65 TaxID=3344659 RepID=UPI0035F3B2F4